MSTKHPTCMIDVGAIDWKLLREQKLALLKLDNNEEADGLVNLLDDIQDKAAKILGERVVFCRFNHK